MFEIKDLAGLSEPVCRVIDCLGKGISSVASPIVYKRMERAKIQMEKQRTDQSAIASLKEAMTQDFIEVARTTRDRQEIQNIASIYGKAIQELQAIDHLQLPEQQVTPEWAAHFYDSAKDCCDEEVQVLWAKVLAGEIQGPGKFYKRTINNLRLVEKHEAEWFCRLCQFIMEGAYFPILVLENEYVPFNQFQSLVDAGFINADQGSLTIEKDGFISLKSTTIDVHCLNTPYYLTVYTLTDMGSQLASLVQVETDRVFQDELVRLMNESKQLEVRAV